MGRISATFEKLRRQGKKALIPYIMAGDPDLSTTQALVLALEQSGADIIELGIPFSDPLADGPVIQRASDRSLRNKTSLRAVMDLVRTLRRQTQIPLVLMSYYNPIYKYGEEKFAEDALAYGVDGVIIPDLPPEEAGQLIQISKRIGLDTIFLLAPTSTRERIRRVSESSRGFIYYVSLTGITGAALSSVREIKAKLQEIRRYSTKPIAVGFGISTPAQASQVARWADGVIIGSALVKLVESHLQDSRLVKMIGEFVQRLNRAVKSPSRSL
ncbi:MAG TPA: tryptophan synthase subunit alpha [Nitrospiria bacterium]|nr:tryptophan synthase subunit alpha [Nitrospiria bacterium]